MAGACPPVEIVGPRLVLRRYERADAVQLHEAILASVDHLLPWMPWAAFEPLELVHREALIAEWLEGWQRGLHFNFGAFEDGVLVGACGLHRRIGPGGLEIGYWTRSGHTGRRIATEAAGCLVEAAFSMPDVELVEVHHDRANVASGRVPQRLGFTFVEERQDAVTAPAEIGIDWVWRLHRSDRSGLATGS